MTFLEGDTRLQVLERSLKRTKSPSTASQYLWVARHFLTYAKGDFSRAKVLDFIDWLSRENKSYARWAHYALRTFFKVMKKEGLIEADFPLDKDDLPPKPGELEVARPAMSREQIASLVSWARVCGRPRDLAFLALATVYGLRSEEMRLMKRTDIDHGLLVRTVKHGEIRRHLVPQEIRLYLEEYHYPRISEGTVNNSFRRICDESGLRRTHRMGWHSIRRSLDTLLQMAGVPAAEVWYFLRWSRPAHMPGYYFNPASSEEVDRDVFQKHPFLELWR
jgi:hypothetical protein